MTEIVESAAEQARLKNNAIKILIRLAVGGAGFAMGYLVWVSLKGSVSWYVGAIPLSPVLVALTVLLTGRGPE